MAQSYQRLYEGTDGTGGAKQSVDPCSFASPPPRGAPNAAAAAAVSFGSSEAPRLFDTLAARDLGLDANGEAMQQSGLSIR